MHPENLRNVAENTLDILIVNDGSSSLGGVLQRFFENLNKRSRSKCQSDHSQWHPTLTMIRRISTKFFSVWRSSVTICFLAVSALLEGVADKVAPPTAPAADLELGVATSAEAREDRLWPSRLKAAKEYKGDYHNHWHITACIKLKLQHVHVVHPPTVIILSRFCLLLTRSGCWGGEREDGCL